MWWEFNKDAYLHVRAAVVANRPAGAHPRSEEIDRDVLPALTDALRATGQPDLTSACLVALGKATPDGAMPSLREVVLTCLRSGVQETRETAALTLGITRRARGVDDPCVADLVALVSDDRRGGRLLDRERVDERTRAFAAYALGLLAEHSDDVAVRAHIGRTLRTVLQRASARDLEVALAAVQALRLTAPAHHERSLPAWTLRQEIIDALWAFAQKRAGKGEQVVQSHAMLGAARLLAGADAAVTARYLAAIVAELGERESRPAAFAQSAALAAGFLAQPADESTCAALRNLAQSGKDKQARAFATIALGQIGGDDNRAFLIKLLAQGHKVTVKPWAALALGVLRYHARARGGSQAAEDAVVGRALQDALAGVKSAEARGAFAVALGLAGYAPAAAAMRALLAEHDRQDELNGYLGLGLAMIGDREAIAPLREISKRALRRPHLLRQLAVSLALLRDRGMANELLDLLREGDLNVASLGAVAGALGQVGDAASLPALIKLVRDAHAPDLARAFAAAALGGIVDRAPMPFHVALSAGANYAAAMPTLTDGVAGVLDIL
jgi:hypothetical protein